MKILKGKFYAAPEIGAEADLWIGYSALESSQFFLSKFDDLEAFFSLDQGSKQAFEHFQGLTDIDLGYLASEQIVCLGASLFAQINFMQF